jgi:hypothetical protein
LQFPQVTVYDRNNRILSYPSSETGLIIGIWFAIGVIVLIYLYVRHPARLPKMQEVFSDDVAPATAGSMAGQEGA